MWISTFILFLLASAVGLVATMLTLRAGGATVHHVRVVAAAWIATVFLICIGVKQEWHDYKLLGVEEHGPANCSTAVPRTVWITSATKPSRFSRAVALENPAFTVNVLDDGEADQFVQQHCPAAYRAYTCVKPGAFKSDIFRACALHIKGGIYMDADTLPLLPLAEFPRNCFGATLVRGSSHKYLHTDVFMVPICRT